VDEVKATLLQAVTNAGGKIAWDPLVASVSFENRRYFMGAIKALEAEGVLKRVVTAVPGGSPTFEVVKL
jgi:hypothetical protein